MSRAGPPRRRVRGWLPLLAGAALGCAAAPPPAADSRSAPAWARRPPPGCALGSSGPTLDPGDAIRRARRSALENLAAAWLGVRVVSEQYLHASRAREWSLQETSGVLGRSRVVALAVGRDPAPGRWPARREIFALACPARLPAPVATPPRHPDWLIDGAQQEGRPCALAVGGPTRRPGDQYRAALRDGRRGLAESIEIRIRRQSFDDLRGRLRVVSQSEASERAERIAADVDRLEARWLDARGAGPLRTPGVLYGLVCAGRDSSDAR